LKRKELDGEMNCTPIVRQYRILKTMGVLFMPGGVPNKSYSHVSNNSFYSPFYKQDLQVLLRQYR